MGIEESKIASLSQETYLNFSGKKLTTIPSNIPTSNSVVATLVLSDNKLEDLPKKLKNLTNLNISSNNFVSLSPNIRNALLSYPLIEILDLSNNQITDMGNILNEIPTLRRVSLFSNKLTTISFERSKIESIDLGNNLLTQCPTLPDSLVSLSLDRNQISTLQIDQSTNKLGKLCASRNKITEMKVVTNLSSLVTCDLSENLLQNTPNFSVAFPRLHQINLSNNQLTKFPTFPKTVTEVNLAANSITTIPAVISTFSTLVFLNMSHNKVNTIEGSLPSSLLVLYLYDNEMVELTSQMQFLQRVFMMNNCLKSVPSFPGNTVTEYYLSYNKLTKLSLQPLSNRITRLDVSNNDIAKLPDDIFTQPFLTHLFAAHNKLNKVPEKFGSSQIILLNLSGNPILKLPDEYPQTLEQLYLSSCGLSDVPTALCSLPDLVELDVSHNKICQIPDINSLQKLIASMNKLRTLPNITPSLEHIDVSGNELAALPDCLVSRSLRYLDISANKIAALPKDMILPQLNVLKMQNNPIKGPLTIKKFQKLQYIDCSNTDTYFNQIPGEHLNLFSSQPGLCNSMNQKVISTRGKAAYATIKGLKESQEDPLVVRTNYANHTHFYGIIDGRGGRQISPLIAYKVSKGLARNAPVFSEETIKKVDQIVQRTCTKTNELVPPDYGFVMFYNSEFYLTCTGRVRFLQISEQCGEEIVSEEMAKYPKDQITLTRTHGPVPSIYNEGANFVYGCERVPMIVKSKVRRNDKWLLILSVAVTDVIEMHDIVELANECSDPMELALSVKNLAYANMSSDNISVIAIDLTKMQKSSQAEKQ